MSVHKFVAILLDFLSADKRHELLILPPRYIVMIICAGLHQIGEQANAIGTGRPMMIATTILASATAKQE